jgi:hypothetical protein
MELSSASAAGRDAEGANRPTADKFCVQILGIEDERRPDVGAQGEHQGRR